MNGKPTSFINSDVNVFVMKENMASVLNVHDWVAAGKNKEQPSNNIITVLWHAHKAWSKTPPECSIFNESFGSFIKSVFKNKPQYFTAEILLVAGYYTVQNLFSYRALSCMRPRSTLWPKCSVACKRGFIFITQCSILCY